jgi:hypothetical protein
MATTEITLPPAASRPSGLTAFQLSQLLDEAEIDGISLLQDPLNEKNPSKIIAYFRIQPNKQSPLEIARYHVYGILHSGRGGKVKFVSRTDQIEFDINQHDQIQIPCGIKYQFTSTDEPLIFTFFIDKEGKL